MKIALYGNGMEELNNMKQLIKEYLNSMDISLSIDFYVHENRLKVNVSKYDIISLSERFIEILEYRAPKKVIFS